MKEEEFKKLEEEGKIEFIKEELPKIEIEEGDKLEPKLEDYVDLLERLQQIKLNDIKNVNAPSPTSDQSLVFNASNSQWVAKTIELDDIEDVNAPSPTDNQALTWDAATSKWIPETITPGIATGWELIASATFSSSPVNITGLDGNTAELYMLIISVKDVDWIANVEVTLRFNGDAGANYNRVGHIDQVSAGSPSTGYHYALNDSKIDLQATTGKYSQFFEIFIRPISGYARKILWQGSSYTDPNNFFHIDGTGIWTNGTDNITQINLLIGGGSTSFTGRYWLFKKK